MADHLMIDLETMSTAGDAAILSIGLQPFDPRGDGIDPAAGLLLHVDLQASMNAGLRVDASTILWWLSQSDDARAGLVARDPLMLSVALQNLVDWGKTVVSWKWVKVWANGAAFDPPILENAFRRCRIDIPWEYSNVLDVRTMKWLAPDVPKVAPTVAHDALSDAQAQAIYVQRCYAAIKPVVVEPPAPAEPSPIQAFYDALERHDWSYMMSDDPNTNRRGEAAESALRSKIQGGGPIWAALYDAYKEHIWRGGDKPDRPTA